MTDFTQGRVPVRIQVVMGGLCCPKAARVKELKSLLNDKLIKAIK